MRWFWFATFTLICGLLSVFFRQPLILIGELFLIDLFITRKVKWFFWIPKSEWKFPGWLNLLLWLGVTVWIIRVLAIDSITISSPALKPTLQIGDNVLISKIHYGPSLPVINRRLSGLTDIRHGDLIAYHFPEGDSTVENMESVSYYSWKRRRELEKDTLDKPVIRYREIERRAPEVSKCVGLPGDTVTISHGFDGRSFGTVQAVDYLVEVGNRQLPAEFLSGLGIGPSEVQILPGLGYLIPLRDKQVAAVRQRPEVNALAAYHLEADRGDYNIFPHDMRFPWNRDNFGPVIVPKKGDNIRLNLLNLSIYQRIIEVYEKNKLEVKGETISINGFPVHSYTFKQDYYFVMGDNRHHSRDSRHWGFLPQDHIIGKPVLIWFSGNCEPGSSFKINWKRILNTL